MPPVAAAAGQVVLPCPDLDAAIAFFTAQLGFRLETIMPADEPAVAVVSGHDLVLRLERDHGAWPGRLRLGSDDLRHRHGPSVVAPNGTVVELVAPIPPMVVPPLAARLELTRAAHTDAGGVGRAGMRYRDLLPARQGGRFIASHITIPDGGPVPDYVHHHRIRFQVIYCRRGWVRVVYEDQGQPFVLEAGDCVLQPSGIRHRVLESSAGLEVIEVTSPAEHVTHVDHDLALPTAVVRPDRRFEGQTFVRHRSRDAVWGPWRGPGFEARDTGVGAATGGLGDVARRPGRRSPARRRRGGTTTPSCCLWFVISGTATLRLDGRPDEGLAIDDAVAIPAGLDHALTDCSDDLEVLEVMVASR